MKLTVAVAVLLGLYTVQAGRLVVRDDDPDEIELNGSALKSQSDVGVYAKTFLGEGKNINKLNQEEEDRKNGEPADAGKAIDDISKTVSLSKLNKPQPPMIEKAESSKPIHIDLEVPKSKPKKKEEVMTR